MRIQLSNDTHRTDSEKSVPPYETINVSTILSYFQLFPIIVIEQ